MKKKISKNLLLVEGKSDKEFFSAVCKKIGIDTDVTVFPPKEIGAKFNNKEGLINSLSIIIPQLFDGQYNRIAAIVDADSESYNGLGWEKTIDRFTTAVASFKFTPKFASLGTEKNRCGFRFCYPDKKIHDFGLWIMPGDNQDGILEDWIKALIKPQDKLVLDHAIDSVSKLSTPKFKHQHRVKAEVATWLAWQEHPGRGAEFAISHDLLDESGPGYKKLTLWLHEFFLVDTHQ